MCIRDSQYSIPKQIAIDLINMHQARGDQIYFITGRTAGDKDGVTPVLQKAFNIKAALQHRPDLQRTLVHEVEGWIKSGANQVVKNIKNTDYLNSDF